jgi:SAM-dependent methyltransferase
MSEWHARETAAQWDADLSGRLPTRAEQQGVLLTLLAAAEIGDGAVLDLGVGSGLVAEAVLETLPDARLVGVDYSAAMLELARERLLRFGARVDLTPGDLASVGRIKLPDLGYRLSSPFRRCTTFRMPRRRLRSPGWPLLSSPAAWSSSSTGFGLRNGCSMTGPFSGVALIATRRRLTPNISKRRQGRAIVPRFSRISFAGWRQPV